MGSGFANSTEIHDISSPFFCAQMIILYAYGRTDPLRRIEKKESATIIVLPRLEEDFY